MPQDPRMRIRLIGPSGHKSEYHCATLLGNWHEERTSFGHKDPAKEPMEGQTTYRASYKGTSTEEELLAAKPPGCFCASAPQQMLFYHGDILAPPENLLSVHELSYTDPTTGSMMTLKDILDKEGVSQRRERTDKLRRSMGFSRCNGSSEPTSWLGKGVTAVPPAYGEDTVVADKNLISSTRSDIYRPPPIPPIGRLQEKERFLTTKNVTVDATGEYLKDNIDEYPATSSKCWGIFMEYKDDPMQRTKLREEYEA